MLADETNWHVRRRPLPGAGARCSTGSRSATPRRRLYNVTVYEKPTVLEVEAAYEFPAYLERARETVKQNQGDLEAPSSPGRS